MTELRGPTQPRLPRSPGRRTASSQRVLPALLFVAVAPGCGDSVREDLKHFCEHEARNLRFAAEHMLETDGRSVVPLGDMKSSAAAILAEYRIFGFCVATRAGDPEELDALETAFDKAVKNYIVAREDVVRASHIVAELADLFEKVNAHAVK